MANYSGNSSYPLGLRNNNPGNLRSGVAWLGVTGENEGFSVFSDSLYGLRAMAVDLSTKINDDGLDTVTAIITKYAPPSENNTSAYIASVAASMGVDADATLTSDPETLASLMRAQINVEQGEQYSELIPDADIATGISMRSQSILSNPAAALSGFINANPEISIAAGVSVVAATIIAILIITKKLSLNFLKNLSIK